MHVWSKLQDGLKSICKVVMNSGIRKVRYSNGEQYGLIRMGVLREEMKAHLTGQ